MHGSAAVPPQHGPAATHSRDAAARRARRRSRSTLRSRTPSAPPTRAGRRGRAPRRPRASARARRRARRPDRRQELGDELRLDDDARAGQEHAPPPRGASLRNPRIAGGAAEGLREVRHRRDRRFRRRRGAGARRRGRSRSRAGRATWIASPARARRARACPAPIGSTRNASSPGGARQRLIGRGAAARAPRA